MIDRTIGAITADAVPSAHAIAMRIAIAPSPGARRMLAQEDLPNEPIPSNAARRHRERETPTIHRTRVGVHRRRARVAIRRACRAGGRRQAARRKRRARRRDRRVDRVAEPGLARAHARASLHRSNARAFRRAADRSGAARQRALSRARCGRRGHALSRVCTRARNEPRVARGRELLARRVPAQREFDRRRNRQHRLSRRG